MDSLPVLNGILQENMRYRIVMMWSYRHHLFIFLAVPLPSSGDAPGSEILGDSWGGFQPSPPRRRGGDASRSPRLRSLQTTLTCVGFTGQLYGSCRIASVVKVPSNGPTGICPHPNPSMGAFYSIMDPFSNSVAWAIPILIGVYFAPESTGDRPTRPALKRTSASLLD